MQWIAQENQPDGSVGYRGQDDSYGVSVYTQTAEACHAQLREAVEKAKRVAIESSRLDGDEPHGTFILRSKPTSSPSFSVQMARRLRAWADWFEEESD